MENKMNSTKNQKTKKDFQFRIRLTSNEKKLFAMESNKRDLSISDFLRRSAKTVIKKEIPLLECANG